MSKKYDRLPSVVSTSMDYCTQQDFNPDMVLCGCLDCYEEGTKKGTLIGLGVSAVVAGVVFATNRLIKRVRQHLLEEVE